ncbi:MAG: SLC13 family permease [Symbiobacteriaceae bacterium]|nr:SLC13 family permease [Symbiobacteriaceae bacterium]
MFIPEIDALSVAALRTLCLAVAFFVCLISEALPLAISCWVALGMMPLIGVATTFGDALSGFANPVVFFILASFGIAAAFTTLPLSQRVMIALLRKFGKNIKLTLLSLMLCIMPVTFFVSSVPTCALFMTIGLSFLGMYEDEAAKKATGRAFMIAIPVTCLIGGMATPVGSSINLLAIDLLEQYTGLTISFVQWMSVGIPLVILTLPIAWLLIYHIYKPAEINPAMVERYIADLAVPPQLSQEEKKVMAVTVVMLTLWILSSWFKQINITVVTLLGVCVLFFPGIKILEWQSFIRKVNLDSFFLVGTVLSIGKAMEINGVSAWIASLFPTGPMSLFTFLVFVVTLVFLILVIMPVGPSVVMFMAMPVISLAQAMGFSPICVTMALALAAGNCYILPLDTVPQLTYSTGYYGMLDLPRSSVIIQICLIVLIPSALWVAHALLGIM